jgi:ubiquitin carboxyl-terminal hydrolase 34
LKQLPNVFIIHLQRIVFNLDTLMNDKISDRLEFPKELNVRPYTREALMEMESRPKEVYDYHLKGVVVHTGAA